ncbi:MAG: sugar phosphate isomerase/epimerase [Armatimonadetes bacterium]|nr:sugar phosphate isomerase/epimerase [Armatimonadota bacterium]
MRYATAIWNYAEPEVRLVDLVREFASFGYDTISLSSGQFGDPEGRELREAAELIAETDLAMTLHCGFAFGVDGVQQALDLLGERLLAITFDPLSEVDSCGSRFATGQMAPVLAEILRRTAGSAVRVGIEDLPLDARALDTYRADLGPLVETGRYGMLLDVGHLNLRRRQWPYFRGLSVAEYVERIPVPIIEAHLHDNNGQADQHGHFGFGDLDFGSVAEALKAVGFEGVSTIEIAPSFHDSSPPESKPHARASLEQWKQLWEA